MDLGNSYGIQAGTIGRTIPVTHVNEATASIISAEVEKLSLVSKGAIV